jgi:AraC-like DNA-binding protein
MLWKGGKVPLGVQYYCYPSARAQRFWNYMLVIGKSETESGFVAEHKGRDGFIFHLIQSGEMWYDVAGKRFSLKRGGACLLDFRVHTRYGNEGTKPVENWWVWFNGRDMPALYADLRADVEPEFSGIDSDRATDAFNELLDLAVRHPPGFEALSAAGLQTLLALFFAQRARTGDLPSVAGQTGPLSTPVRKGVDYITRAYNEQQTLKRISAIAGRSISSFAREFHKEVGMPPMLYLSHYRVEQAKRLLVHSNSSVAEIAQMVGISRANYFTRLFIKVTGMSPTRYRKEQRGKKG